MQALDVSDRVRRASLADVIHLESIFRYKIPAFLAAAGVVALTFLYLWTRDRQYESMARVFVRLGRESVTVDPTAGATGQVLTISESQQREIQSAIDILESPGLAEHVVDTLGPQAILDFQEESAAEAEAAPPAEWQVELKRRVADFRQALVPWKLADPPNPRAKAISAVGKAIKIQTEHQSNVVAIQARAESPRLAQKIVEVLLAGFQDRYLSAHRSPGAIAFFGEQTGHIKTQLDEVTNQLRDVKTAAGFASIADQKLALAERLKSIDAAVVEVRADSEAAQARLAKMQQSLAITPERVVSQEVTGLTNTSRDDMRGRLYQVELDKAEIRSVYTSEHPMVKKLNEKVREAEEVLKKEPVSPEVTTALNHAYQEMNLSRMMEESQIAAHAARLTELTKQRDALALSIRELNQREVEIDDLERERSLLDTKYRRYVENLEQARIDGALEQNRLSSVNVFQTPSLNDDPMDPSNSIVALAGCVAACFTALGTTIGMAYLRNDLSQSADVERALALPVLASIPWTRRHRVQLG